MDGAVCLSIFFRLLKDGVPSDRALRIARAFVFMGETGNGLRAFNANTPRPAGQVFEGSQDTFLVTVAGVLPADAEDGIAFVPGCDLTALRIMEWLDFHESESAPLCLVNLSEVVQQMRVGLDGDAAPNITQPGAGTGGDADDRERRYLRTPFPRNGEGRFSVEALSARSQEGSGREWNHNFAFREGEDDYASASPDRCSQVTRRFVARAEEKGGFSDVRIEPYRRSGNFTFPNA